MNRLITRAGYPNWTKDPAPKGGKHSEEFWMLLQALRYIGDRKVDEYGNSRMEVDADIPDYDLKMLFSDLYRKHIRIEELMHDVKMLIWGDEQPNHDLLMETLGDLAVYAVRGIQILRRLEEAHGTKARIRHGRKQRSRPRAR